MILVFTLTLLSVIFKIHSMTHRCHELVKRIFNILNIFNFRRPSTEKLFVAVKLLTLKHII